MNEGMTFLKLLGRFAALVAIMVALMIALLAAGVMHTIDVLSARARAATAVCHTVDEVASWFPGDETVAYDFAGDDGRRLGRAFETSDTPVADLHVVLNLSLNDYDIFSFAADGCGIGRAMGLTFDQVSAVFAVAGVTAPFGATFYALPNILR